MKLKILGKEVMTSRQSETATVVVGMFTAYITPVDVCGKILRYDWTLMVRGSNSFITGTVGPGDPEEAVRAIDAAAKKVIAERDMVRR